MRKLALAAAVAAVAGSVSAATVQDAATADAARMHAKVTAIVARGENTTTRYPAPLRTRLVEREVNAYFRVNGHEFLPEGVVDPQVTIAGGGRLRARAIVDLEAALQQRQRSMFDPLSWLGGKAEVTMAGVVRTSAGMGELTLQEATLAGISVPPSLLQQLVSYYTRSPEAPNGFALDEPFELPANISTIEMTPGVAVVVQP